MLSFAYLTDIFLHPFSFDRPIESCFVGLSAINRSTPVSNTSIDADVAYVKGHSSLTRNFFIDTAFLLLLSYRDIFTAPVDNFM